MAVFPRAFLLYPSLSDGVLFPNGMVVTPDNSTLILAESYGQRLTAFDIEADGGLSTRRVWADLDGGVPDGICLDALSKGASMFTYRRPDEVLSALPFIRAALVPESRTPHQPSE